MILRYIHLLPSCVLLLALQLACLSTFTTATDSKKDAPSIAKYKFDHAPAGTPQYFADSDNILILVRGGTLLRSTDAGATFASCPDVPESSAWDVYLHPYEPTKAYIWGKHGIHYATADSGASWREFKIDGWPVSNRPPFSFHAGESQKIIVNICQSMFLCDEIALYTLDGFKTEVKVLKEGSRGCVWARGTPEFGQNFVADPKGEDDKGTDNDSRAICILMGRFIDFPFGARNNRLVVSDNFFEDEQEPIIENGRTVQGIVNIAPVKGFLVAAASASKTDELALYVSDDGNQWHRAVFPQDHRLEEDAYTMLESTNYSIQVDVMTSPSPLNSMGVLFTSNSNGTYFTRNIEHTNRNFKGMVDFEKITGIQGIVLVNIVDNWEAIEEMPLDSKKIKSKISFDDGRTFQKITADDDEIHLHSVTDLANMGKVFSSPAPGLAMGVGNKGKFLKDYEDGDLYVSDDACVTWRKALKNAHIFEFGDRGAVLVAIYDEGETNEIEYSIDHGKNWEKTKLPVKVKARLLTTVPDSTSLKFFLIGTVGDGPEAEHYAFCIDFADYHDGGKCKESDFEKWYARVDDKGEATCIMGHKQYYRRRKADSKCFVDKEFQDPVPEFEPCSCTKSDFECDYNFVPSKNKEECEPSGALKAPDGVCGKDDDKFRSSSGFRLIPGNQCDPEHKDSVNLDKEVERDCKGSFKAPATGDVSAKKTTFDTAGFAEYHYLERNDKSGKDDETIIARTSEGHVWITRDAAKSWKQILKDEKIVFIYPHLYMNDVAFFLTEGKKVHYTYNRGETFGHFKAPAEFTKNHDRIPVLGFHPNYKDWLIWTGAVDCGHGDEKCHNVAFFSEDRGANWEHRLRYVNKCEFIESRNRTEVNKLVYCEQFKNENLGENLQLKWSDNWFADDHEVFGDIIDFATMSEFIVVAARRDDDHDALSCHTSVDGKNFAHAEFPPSFNVPLQKAYTVLESKTHAVFLHVTVNNMENTEYGSIIKSNSNGTNYVMSLSGVNRNGPGYVDFEKMHILEGVMLANIVQNIEDAERGKPKSLQTVITHNDGAQWAPIGAPAKDSEKKAYGCDVSNTDSCSLHLHGYTERPDKRATFSSKSAIGILIGVGNVGPELLSKDDGDTFISTDGGLEWKEVHKGAYMWAYGDSGSVIMIVPESKPTKSVLYTLDEGRSWKEYKFTDKEVPITSLSTVPSDRSRNFVLWSNGDASGDTTTFNIDFGGLTDKICELDENHPDAGDFYFWSPKHPNQPDNCLFGHVAQYHRKNVDADCYIGVQDYEKLHTIAKNCDCRREDFEWYTPPKFRLTETLTDVIK